MSLEARWRDGNVIMIDRDARDRLAEALRQMATGRLSAVEVCERLEQPSQDAAIGAVLDHFEIEKKAVQAVSKWQWKRQAMRREQWRVVARAVVFLHGDRAYQPRSVWAELRLRMHGIYVADDGLWPFETQAELDAARREVRLLAG